MKALKQCSLDENDSSLEFLNETEKITLSPQDVCKGKMISCYMVKPHGGRSRWPFGTEHATLPEGFVQPLCL